MYGKIPKLKKELYQAIYMKVARENTKHILDG
jgi:hypothetical protein